jgi:hypothetical protein
MTKKMMSEGSQIQEVRVIITNHPFLMRGRTWSHLLGSEAWEVR